MRFHQQPTEKRYKSNEKGMTLVEVMIALMVFSVGVIAVALMLSNATRYSSSARFITEASELAQHKMEQLTNAPYNDSELDPAFSPYGPVTVGNYSISWEVRENVPMTAMKTIRLTVNWNDYGKSKNLSVAAIKQ